MLKWKLVLLTLAFVLVWNTAFASAWFGEEGGYMLHRDPYCSHRQVKLREPFAHAFRFDSIQSLYEDGQRTPCTYCCGFPEAEAVLPESFRLLWNATVEEKAAMLPGVWTLPSQGAVSPETAYLAAKEYAAVNPDFRQYLDSQLRCTASVMHYDASGMTEEQQRETYKVLLTTTKMEDIGIVYVDALTGQVYGAVSMPSPELEKP